MEQWIYTGFPGRDPLKFYIHCFDYFDWRFFAGPLVGGLEHVLFFCIYWE